MSILWFTLSTDGDELPKVWSSKKSLKKLFILTCVFVARALCFVDAESLVRGGSGSAFGFFFYSVVHDLDPSSRKNLVKILALRV